MQNIEHHLKTRIQNESADTFLVIVPDDAARLKRLRELVGYHPNKAVANLRVYHIENFIRRLYNQVPLSKHSITQGLQNLWMHEIANLQSDTYEALRPNRDVSVPDSTLSLIIDTINRLRERGESVSSIVADNPTQADLVRMYENYETRLADRWIDEQGKSLYLANNFSPQLMRRAFPRVNLVVVEGFSVLSRAAIKTLTCIAEMPAIQMWFRADWFAENEDLYKNIADLAQQFEAVHARIDPTYQRETDQHQHFAENLFRTGGTTARSPRDPKRAAQIKVLRPADRSEEVEEIARQIQKHVSEKDCNFSEICVAYYNVGLYQQRIAEIFPAYGIPYSLVESTPLTKSEVVKAIFSHLSPRREPRNGDYFSNIEESDAEPAPHERLLHPNAFQEYVDDLLKKGEVVQNILNPMLQKDREIVEAEVQAYHQFNRIVKELCNVLMSEGVGADFLANYVEKLRHIAKRTSYRNRVPVQGETVRIVQLGELRSREFEAVFLGDFVDGRFPENYRPDPLLPEIPYRTEEEQLHDNRFLFYRVLKSFRQRLYLLVPKREGEADLIPSPFLEQLKAVADLEEIEVASPVQGGVPGFLSAYGDHVWSAEVPSDGEFPDAFVPMRSLIDHVVKVEKSREETHAHLTYEGVLTAEALSDESRARLERRRRRTYAVTELETYAKCPFQYFVGNILSLRTKDEEEDELSNLERGSLLHEVLRTFYHNRRERGEPSIADCGEGELEAAKRQLNEVLENVSEKYRGNRQDNPIGENNLFWNMDIEKLRVALHKWIQAEHAENLSVQPSYFEVSFGQEREPRDPELSTAQPVVIGDVRMTGKIDRIDIANGAFNIIDYKTGSSTVRMQEILNGRSLQLPIYLQIAKKLLQAYQQTELEPAAGLYHKIRLDQCTVELGIGAECQNGVAYKNYNGKNWRKVSSRNGQLLPDDVFADRLERVSGYVQHYVERISRGNFPLITRVDTFVDLEEDGGTPITPRNKTEPCNYCAYKRVCRVGVISERSPFET